MLTRRTLALAAGPLLAARAAHADFNTELTRRGTLVVGTTGASPPATMYDAGANLVGYDIDLARKIAGDLGLRVEFVTLEWSGMLAGVQAGRFDMVASSVARTPERIASADFIISDPYVVNGVAGARRANDGRIARWEDVCGKTVGIVKGAAEIRFAQSVLPAGCITNIREYPSWSELLLDLQNGRIDALVGNYLTPSYMITANRRPLAMLDRTLQVTTSGLVIRKQSPLLAAKVNELIARYRGDGSLQTLTERWVGRTLDWSLVQS